MLECQIRVALRGLEKMSKKYQKTSHQQQQQQQQQQPHSKAASEQQSHSLAGEDKRAPAEAGGGELGAGQASRKRPKLVRQTGVDISQHVESSDAQDSGLARPMLDEKNVNGNTDVNSNKSNEATKLKCDNGETTMPGRQATSQDQRQELQKRKPATDSGATAHGKQNICAACSKPIRERYLLVALGKHWHEDCLKCACCDCRLGEVGSSLFTHSDKILCRRDFLRIFGQHGNCAACKRSIPPYELVMRANDNAYHMDCFACQRCQYRFCVGDRFHLTETHKIICLLCHTDQQQQQHQLQSSASFLTPTPAAASASASASASTGDVDYQRAQTGAGGGEFVELSRLELPPAPSLPPLPPSPTSDMKPTLPKRVPSVTSDGSALVPRNTSPASGQQQASPSQVSSCHNHQQQPPSRTAAAGS